jgi:hypothetical protein
LRRERVERKLRGERVERNLRGETIERKLLAYRFLKSHNFKSALVYEQRIL